MAETTLPGINLPYTGITSVDAGFTIISQQLARTASDLQIALNPPDGGGGTGGTGTGGVPTNSPTPSGINSQTNPDGSMDITLTWNYTQGAIQADYIVLFWVQGAAPLAPPTTADKALLLVHTARSITFNGWNPSSNYRFGIAAGRKDEAGTSVGVGTISSPTSAPDWADISMTGNYTASISGTPASTVVANAANGATAYNETTNYRSDGAPSNLPDPNSLTTGTDTDGSARYTIGWTYTQGARKADGFFFFVKEGNTSTFALTDPHFELGAQNTGTFNAAITLKGYPSDRALSFGVAAFRRTDIGLEIGTITTSAASPDWQGITTGTPNYAGTIWGVEQHNFTLVAIGRGSPLRNDGLSKDGTAISWPGRDIEFEGNGVRGGLAINYNVSIYDLPTKALDYQHCFALSDYGDDAVANEDLFTVIQSGGGVGTLQSAHPGKWGYGLRGIATDSSERAYIVTQGASALYTDLAWVELWFKHAGNPVTTGAILSLTQTQTGDTAYQVPALVLLTDGRVQARAFNGTAFVTVTSDDAVTDGNWHHIAAAISGGIHIWIDGARNATPAGVITTFTMGAPAALYLRLGYCSFNSGQVTGTAFYDELIVTTNPAIRATGTDFVPPTKEESDFAIGLPGTWAIWHFQEPLWDTLRACNARKASAALYHLINSYCQWQLANAETIRKLFIIGSGYDARNGRLGNNLPDAIALLGGSRALFLSSSFQFGSAYALVGRPNMGEGNGIESYAGEVPDSPQAHITLSFQTQGEDVVALSGTGWSTTDIPGDPTNNPDPSSASVVTRATGEDTITIGWTYTQPLLTGDNKIADGFVVYAKEGTTAAPHTAPTAAYYVAIEARSFSIDAPFGLVWSFAIAAFRRTSSGVEIGPPVTSAAGPDWQGIGGVTQVTTPGLAPGAVTNPTLAPNAVATPNIQDEAITTAKYAALSVDTAAIGNLAVSSAKIQNLAVANAHIQNLAVDTIKVGNNAITSDKRQLVALLTGSYNILPESSQQFSLTHPLGRIPLVTVDTNNSAVQSHIFALSSTQIFVSLRNTLVPPSAAQTGTVEIFFW